MGVFSLRPQKRTFLGDSQEYPIAYQRLAAIAGGQEVDNRKTGKAERNALGMDLKMTTICLILPNGVCANSMAIQAHCSPSAAGKCVCGFSRR